MCVGIVGSVCLRPWECGYGLIHCGRLVKVKEGKEDLLLE